KASVTQIHLVDPSALVIQTLKKKLLDSDIPREEIIQIHHQRGQELTLRPDISKCLFIAGMGGKEIQEILQNLLPQLGAADRVVISPHRKILELRNYLHTSEFGLISEETLF